MNKLTNGTRVTITEMQISGTVLETNGFTVLVETDTGETVSVTPNQVTVQSFLTEGQ